MKKLILDNNILNDIDTVFADLICDIQSTSSDNQQFDDLWLLAAFLSYSANNGDSSFAPKFYENKLFSDVFNIKNQFKFNVLSEVNQNNLLNQKIPRFDIDKLIKYSKVIGKADSTPSPVIVFDGEQFYLNKFYFYEKQIAEFIKKRLTNKLKLSDKMKSDVNSLFPNIVENKINWQKIAAVLALTNNFLVISGGPGTGKTTTAGSILALLLMQNQKRNIKMIAPTGKAADRLNESINTFKLENKSGIDESIIDIIPENAETIHRYLGINSFKPTFTKYNKSPVDVLLIDEASMVSLPLFAKTFEVLNDDCKVILLGDKDQLMAVENGNVLNDITSAEELNKFSKKFVDITKEITDNEIILPVADDKNNPIENIAVQLEHSWRFQSDSGIGELSKRVNSADSKTDYNECSSIFDKFKDIRIENKTTEKEISDSIKEICDNQLNTYIELIECGDKDNIFKELSQFRILCAINNGPFGVNEINKFIEKTLFPDIATSSFYNGQAIMITKNDYNLKLSNGDVGVILNDNKSGELKAYFRGSENEDYISYNPSSLDEYTTAFAISIHKSQGSEFNKVFIILPPEQNRILTKELLYTGITRAKEECTVIASENIFITAAKTKIVRQSGLKSKLTTE